MKIQTIAAAVCAAASLLACAGSAHADTVLYISDVNGNIGQVDVTTKSVVAGSVHSTQQQLTDVAFTSAGTLYGTTFAGLYTINPLTGAATSVGTYSGQPNMNALVGDGAVLLGAAFSTDTVYTVNPGTAALSTFASISAPSAGDLAFVGSSLYEAAIDGSGNNELYNVSTNTVVGDFTISGSKSNVVFGLADNGTTLYAVAGTEVYTVNAANAVLTPVFDYSTAENGQSLTGATGAAFLNEASVAATPEPSSLLLLATAALGGVGVIRRRA